MAADPLAGLDDVDWSALHHAYGPASDVPAILHSFWSGTADERDEAVNELFSNIWHQRTVYEATPVVVPFLVAMVAHTDCPDRPSLLHLLAEIAHGMNYVDQHATMAWERVGRGDPELEADRQAGRSHVTRSRAAVAAGIDEYRTLLADADVRTSIAAAELLSRFAEDDPQIVDLLLGSLASAGTQAAEGLARLLLELALRARNPIDHTADVSQILNERDDAAELDLYRLLSTHLAGGGAEDGDLVDALLTVINDARNDRERYHRSLEAVKSALASSPQQLVEFLCGWFPHDSSLIRITLTDVATRGAADHVCAGVSALLYDVDVELTAESIDHALEVLGASGQAGIEALEELQHDFEGAQVERHLEHARAQQTKYASTELWWKPPDPAWTVADCVAMIDERLNVRQQDADLRMRAAVRLIELGASAPADVAHRLATLPDDRCQLAAANLLWSAARDAPAAIAILRRQFGGGNLLLTADLARRMGPAAAPLLGDFRDLLEQQRVVTEGIFGEILFAEEAARQAIEAAVAAIEAR